MCQGIGAPPAIPATLRGNALQVIAPNGHDPQSKLIPVPRNGLAVPCESPYRPVHWFVTEGGNFPCGDFRTASGSERPADGRTRLFTGLLVDGTA